mgnify:CR=1 FL=1
MHLGINITLSEFTKVLISASGLFPNSPLTEDFTIEGGVNQLAPSCYTINSGVCLTITTNSCFEVN